MTPPPGAGGLPPGAVPGMPPAFLPPGAGELPKYGTETQKDGSILLKDPDGVVIQVIPPPKARKPQGQPGQ